MAELSAGDAGAVSSRRESAVGGDDTMELPRSESDATAARHNIFIQEIEGMDDYWGSTFRTVYDKSEQAAFRQQLEQRTREHDHTIERMCNFHYQGFIDSIRELLQVRTEASRLKNEVTTVNQELSDASRQLLKHGAALASARRVQANIAAGIAALRGCLPVLETHARLRRQMTEQRFYPALRTLEQLERTLLPRVSRHKFARQIAAAVPESRAAVQAASMSELKDFLELVRRESPRVGRAALRHAAEQYGDGTTEDGGHVEPLYGEAPDEDDDVAAQELVNLSPVYRCLHIFSALGARETFQTYYAKQRQKQASLALQPPANMHETLAAVRDFLQGVAGFFVVEDHVLNTTSGLVTREGLDALWADALARVCSALQTHAAYCTEPHMLLHFKRLTLVVAHALRDYGYLVSPLHELLLDMGDHFSEVLMQRWVTVFRAIFDKDNYHPVQVETAQEYDQISSQFPYQNAQLEKADFPKAFPFSMMVPKVYAQVLEFIQACLRFSDGLNISISERDAMLRRSTNVLLTRTLSGCLVTLIRSPGLGLLQLIQISLNVLYLEQASGHLEDVISEHTGYHAKEQSRLLGRSMFKDIRAESEQQIYRQLSLKLDEFVSLAGYDWLLAEPDGTASPFLTDLIYFLSTTFAAFTNLPRKVAQTACVSACQHVARALLTLLLADQVKQVSLGALQQLNLDVIQCEQFAASDPVPGFEEGALQMCFADLRQLLDLVLDWDWAAYFQQYGDPNGKYCRVSPERAAVVVEKLRDADKRNMFSVLKRADRDRKKLQDTVLKQLRQLAAGKDA